MYDDSPDNVLLLAGVLVIILVGSLLFLPLPGREAPASAALASAAPVPTLMPTSALAVPPAPTIYAAQPQIVSSGAGNVTIINNTTNLYAPVTVCVGWCP
jgi:hypothetical protein